MKDSVDCYRLAFFSLCKRVGIKSPIRCDSTSPPRDYMPSNCVIFKICIYPYWKTETLDYFVGKKKGYVSIVANYDQSPSWFCVYVFPRFCDYNTRATSIWCKFPRWSNNSKVLRYYFPMYRYILRYAKEKFLTNFKFLKAGDYG